MLIAIPSMGRPAKQVTLRNLTTLEMRVKNPVFVCVPENQRRRYDSYMRKGAELVTVPSDVVGIAGTRQWILQNLSDRDADGRILMLDDDMDFCYRPIPDAVGLKTITTSEKMQAMVDQLDGWISEGFMHVGMSARQENAMKHTIAPGVRGSPPYRDVSRMMNAYAYDCKRLLPLVAEGKVELGRMEVMEDFDLTLQLFRLGHANRVSYNYVWNQRGSGAEGGCSTYRTPEMQARAAHRLKELHPDFVTVTVKQSKEGSGSWKDMKERVDVTVKWRDAYASGKPGAA